MSGFSDLFKSKEAGWEQPPQATFTPTPEYPEAQQARESYASKLTGWGEDPNYGAIAPNWDDIWNKAQQRVKQYYWGGAGGQTGLADKVRSSAAARNVSDSPALQTELTNMGYQEAQDIGDISTEMATKEAEFGETGRQNWMSWLSNLMGQKQSGQFTDAKYMKEEPSGIMGLLGSLGGSMLGGAGGEGGGENDWLSTLLRIGGTALGTMVGGPAGGAVGGSVGGALGSSIKGKGEDDRLLGAVA